MGFWPSNDSKLEELQPSTTASTPERTEPFLKKVNMVMMNITRHLFHKEARQVLKQTSSESRITTRLPKERGLLNIFLNLKRPKYETPRPQ